MVYDTGQNEVFMLVDDDIAKADIPPNWFIKLMGYDWTFLRTLLFVVLLPQNKW